MQKNYGTCEKKQEEKLQYIQAITADGLVINIPVHAGQTMSQAIAEYFGK